VAYAPEARVRWQIAGSGPTFGRFAYSYHNLVAAQGRHWHLGVAGCTVCSHCRGRLVPLQGRPRRGSRCRSSSVGRAAKAAWVKRVHSISRRSIPADLGRCRHSRRHRCCHGDGAESVGCARRSAHDSHVESGQRVLYISHNGLTERLGQRGLTYLVGLGARGWHITVISFEKAETATPEAMARVGANHAGGGLIWKPLSYHNRPPVMQPPTTSSGAASVRHGFGTSH
jgi:hypothetical protein